MSQDLQSKHVAQPAATDVTTSPAFAAERDLATLFYAQVASVHEELTSHGMDPNEAGAMALKVAAGVGKMPTFVEDVRRSLEEAQELLKQAKELHAQQALVTGELATTVLNHACSADLAAQKALGNAAHSIFLFFSSLESLHAAFWLPAPPKEAAAAGSSRVTRSTAAAAAEKDAASEVCSASGGDTGNVQEQSIAGTTTTATAPGVTIGGAEPAVGTPPSSTPQQQPQPGTSSSPTPTKTSTSAVAAAGQSKAAGTAADSSKLSGTLAAAGRAQEEEQQQLARLDMAAVQSLYADILAVGDSLIVMALKRGCEQLLETIGSTSHAANPGLLRQLAILLCCPLLDDMDHAGLLEALCSLMVGLSAWMQQRLVAMMAAYDKEEMKRLVVVLQQYITLTLYQQQAITPGVEDATKALGLLHRANETAALLPFSEFYNDAVNNEDFNIKEDFRRWKAPFQRDFSFCTCPYVYDPSSKARILQLENQMAQFNELQGALFRGLLSGSDPLVMCPFLVLKVRRGPHLVQDTLVQINRAKEQDSLRKPLKVKFVGEEGVDEGGVQKEFFQLLVRELFNPDYGMFTYDETTRLNWFRPSDLEMDLEFELVGILIGLAIYNSHILEFQFPRVLYKRLMGQPLGLDDLSELHPEVHASLKKLLEYEGDVADLALCFQVEMEVGFGEMASVDLAPGGSELTVTRENRQEYVAAYTNHLLETSIDRQFSHFQAGFLRLCSGAALSWFRPEELELLVCGGRELNMEALEQATLYDDGYTPTNQVVRWFWEVAHSLSDARKKQLLFFVTGSDRVPIKGLGHLNPPFVISRMGGDSDRLPTAHTCFNHLLLPQYSSKEMLRQRLECALDNAEGFGLM